MKHILIAEFFCGGGVRGVIPASIASEGLSMLRSAYTLFKKLKFKPIIPLDHRLRSFKSLFKDSKLIIVEGGELESRVEELVKLADLSLVIAPEENGVLERVVETVEESGVETLNSTPESIKLSRSKLKVAELCSKIKLKHPKTIRLEELDKSIDKAFELGFPLIIKPIEGAGCVGSRIVKGLKELEHVLGLIDSRKYIAQEYLRGFDASVSLAAGASEVKAISLNAQLIEKTKSSLRYLGGYTPLKHKALRNAFNSSIKLVKAVGLRGYVGVDLVLRGGEAYVIEVNPRLTTSIIGLSKALNRNLFKLILSVLRGGRIEFKFRGVAYFRKISDSEISLIPCVLAGSLREAVRRLEERWFI